MINAIRKNGLVLAIFASVSTGLVALTHYLTEDQINHQEQRHLMSILNQVVPPSLHDNKLYKSCTLVNDPALGTTEAMPAYIATLNGKPSAMAIESIAPDGYSGAIKIIVGIKQDGTITGTRVLAQNETPGLGDKIELSHSNWILSFTGKKVTEQNLPTWKVKKDGGQFDQFTGATITPRAVVKAIKNTVMFVDQNRAKILSQPMNCGAKDD
ncbi:electron transport complex subunit RsxG [Vibrio profundum]|uniref:electron transport complex subunit RsxG n=1 Tax=Vibrio profundum TaxID=2910247 RepID=UPI003D1019F6